MGFLQRVGGREAGRHQSATSQILIACREVLSLVVPIHETLELGAQGVLGEFGL